MRSVVVFLSAMTVSVSSFAMIKGGVSFKDELTYNKQKLVLNGLGVREATVLNVDVYVAGLYLPQKTSDAGKILNSSDAKVLKMRFVRDVPADKINEAWETALTGKGFDQELAQLKTAAKDMKTKDEMIFTFSDKGVSYFINKENRATFKNPAFAKALLGVWLGPNPPNEGLKTGILGL